MQNLYTIFIGDELWENVVDDMNSISSWGVGGMLWRSKSKAAACIKNLRKYNFEAEYKAKFRIVELKEIR